MTCNHSVRTVPMRTLTYIHQINIKHRVSIPMNETSSFAGYSHETPEVQFAKVLENYQLSGNSVSPFDVIQNFISISASRALAIQQNSELPKRTSQEFESWDLETKLWHLVCIMYSFRLSPTESAPVQPAFASYSSKREAFLNSNPKIKELVLILQWLQQNSNDVATEESTQELKWLRTKAAIEDKQLALLAYGRESNIVEQLDVDAPLRSNASITTEDAQKDDADFGIVYELLLSGQNQKAIDYAAQSGNYTLSLILIGAFQDYIDPIIDSNCGSNMDVDEDESIVQNDPSGIKHKYMWYQTVYKLAQNPKLSKKEALIYTFLCGGDLSENIKSSKSWETHMLLHVNQLLTHHLRTFLRSSSSELDNKEIIGSINFPAPQHQSVDGILNTLQSSTVISSQSRNPFRVIMGSVMINQLLLFLHSSIKSTDSQIVDDQHILRVLAHLSVVLVLLGLDEGSKTPTKIITKYISKLSESGLDDLVPVYLSFIPDEKDVRECYSIFLTTIMDSEKRNRQLEILRRLGISAFNDSGTPFSSTTEDFDGQYESKIHNVLKRTVERVMLETQAHYEPQEDIQLKADEIDDVDIKLSRSVEWLYENYMFEDAIIATRTIFQRFLQTGRLRAIKEFAGGKNFKKLLKNYDASVQIQSLDDTRRSPIVSDADKEELLQYDQLGQCLNYLDEWNEFISSKNDTYWQSKDVENSIEKITLNLRRFIEDWLKNPILQTENEERAQMYKEMRSLYVPYVVIELLQVLQQCRLHDWKYMRQAFALINEVANDRENDLLRCFISCGRLREFVSLAGDVALVALEKGTKGIFA